MADQKSITSRLLRSIQKHKRTAWLVGLVTFFGLLVKAFGTVKDATELIEWIAKAIAWLGSGPMQWVFAAVLAVGVLYIFQDQWMPWIGAVTKQLPAQRFEKLRRTREVMRSVTNDGYELLSHYHVSIEEAKQWRERAASVIKAIMGEQEERNFRLAGIHAPSIYSRKDWNLDHPPEGFSVDPAWVKEELGGLAHWIGQATDELDESRMLPGWRPPESVATSVTPPVQSTPSASPQ